MGDKTRGLYNKFSKVERADGRSAEGEKHHGCEYFVLDLTHDLYAIDALIAYAHACWKDYPVLTRDLHRKAAEMQRAKESGKFDEEEPNGTDATE